MRTVFPNRQVAHVWAQQRQSYGRSDNGNGTVRAGCHTVLRSEVERFAAVLGLAAPAGETEVVEA